MNFYPKLSYTSSVICVSLALVASPVLAAPISNADIIANWTPGASPVTGTTDGAWVLNGAGDVTGTSNHTGSLASDFSYSGDFSFSFEVTPVVDDNDGLGWMWGFQDLSNHYRVTWSQDFGESGVGVIGGDGTSGDNGFTGAFGIYDGFKIVKEVGGVSELLFADDQEYVQGNTYAISVVSDISGFTVTVDDITSALTVNIFTEIVGDTTFTSGKVGIHDLARRINTYTNFDFAEGASVVPVPAALPLFGTGLAIMGFFGWRRKRKLV